MGTGESSLMKNDVAPRWFSGLRREIATSFNISELKILCADRGVDFEDVGGEGLEFKAREMISYFSRRGRISELAAYCASARPNDSWPPVDNAGPPPAPAPSKPSQNGKITILFLAADPTDLSRLRLGEGLREIQEKLQLARLRDRFDLQQRLAVRPMDISQALLDIQPQIVHFSGHGSSHGALCLESLTGEAQPVEPAALAALFEQFADKLLARC